MYISSIQIRNYKSYSDSTVVTLVPGFNLVVGQNNAGKTALLEALSLGDSFKVKPHVSEVTSLVPLVDIERSVSTVSFALSGDELRQSMAPKSAPRPISFFLPTPQPNSALSDGTVYVDQDTDNQVKLAEWFLGQSSVMVVGSLVKEKDSEYWRLASTPSFGGYEAVSSKSLLQFEIRSTNRPVYVGRGDYAADNDVGIRQIMPNLRHKIYYFKAERLNIGYGSVGNSPELKPDASNLPEVLNMLQSNHSLMRRFNNAVRTVLPKVRQISVRPGAQDKLTLEVMVWNHDPELGRSELAIPLSECGTGISQVLAMLYVVLTAASPRVIIVDEPSSFLHPGAVKKLLEIFKEHGQHQYIVATHSPTVISTLNPAAITMVTCEDGESKFRTLDARQNGDLQLLLHEVGASLSEVFGADNILWVEGPTEELAFPRILEGISKKSLGGVIIKSVRATGDFETDTADLVVSIYEKMSDSGSLIPPAIGFIFDDELRTQTKKDDLQRQVSNLSFTARRMYENYLLHPEAIATVLNASGHLTHKIITADIVQDWLDKNCKDSQYGKPVNPGDQWFIYVHGADMLTNLFGAMSGGLVTYRKKRDGLALTDWLIKNDPEQLKELADLVVGKLKVV